MGKARDTLRAAKAAVARATETDARRERAGEELQPISDQSHLGLRSYKQSHACDRHCNNPCEIAGMNI
jgi:hypothetical protein